MLDIITYFTVLTINSSYMLEIINDVRYNHILYSVLTINSPYMLEIINDARYNHILYCSNNKLIIHVGDNQR